MSTQDCEQLSLFPGDSPASPSVWPGSEEATVINVRALGISLTSPSTTFPPATYPSGYGSYNGTEVFSAYINNKNVEIRGQNVGTRIESVCIILEYTKNAD